MRWLLPAAVFADGQLQRYRAVGIEDDTVVRIEAASTLPTGTPVERSGAILAPGLFDVQVNGGGGVMLNNSPTREGVRAIAAAHRSVGTAFVLPTVITDYPEVTERAAEAVLAECGQGGVLGIHIEGPHINPERRGTHDPARIRPFDKRTRDLLRRLRQRNMPVLFTAAPETLEPGTIAELIGMGVTVSAGHSAATAPEAERALAEGLTGFTHLFNGMPPMTSRQPGIVGAAVDSTAYCGIIADGHHVDDRMIRIVFRARPRRGRMVLVSDAMSTIAGPDHFELYGETIHVDNGRLVNEHGSLAGTHISLGDSLVRLVRQVGIDPVEALSAATLSPRAWLGLPPQDLVGSRLEDLSLIAL